ncbi:hypothetical protein [Maricaulis sp.]|uniref:hypothetical protein n=1 Tax=Maricaulis sp. TaxID=1486257 RepID=UPI002635F551|nr:hypothetical protein [Maricaulis sp.]
MSIWIAHTRQLSWLLRATWPPLLLAGGCLAVLAVSPPVWIAALACAGLALLTCDALARHRQYRDLRLVVRAAQGLSGGALIEFRRARTSWCTRRAALAAAGAEGFGRDARRLVEKWGYRPWHVFPDRAFTRHSPFLRRGFWRSVVGLR